MSRPLIASVWGAGGVRLLLGDAVTARMDHDVSYYVVGSLVWAVAIALVLVTTTATLLLVARMFRLGFLADFLSRTVLVGFLAGISIHIIVSQLPGVLGLPSPHTLGHGTLKSVLRRLALGLAGRPIQLRGARPAVGGDRFHARGSAGVPAAGGASAGAGELLGHRGDCENRRDKRADGNKRGDFHVCLRTTQLVNGESTKAGIVTISSQL